MGIKEDSKLISDAMRVLGRRTSDRKKKSSAANAALGRKAWLKKQRRIKRMAEHSSRLEKEDDEAGI